MSSNGEMKMSLKLMIWGALVSVYTPRVQISYILVSEMLEELQFSVSTLRQDRRAEGLHDLLDGHRLAGELILGRADPYQYLKASLFRH